MTKWEYAKLHIQLFVDYKEDSTFGKNHVNIYFYVASNEEGFKVIDILGSDATNADKGEGKALAILGNQGWELIEIQKETVYDTEIEKIYSTWYHFKRPK